MHLCGRVEAVVPGERVPRDVEEERERDAEEDVPGHGDVCLHAEYMPNAIGTSVIAEAMAPEITMGMSREGHSG